MKKVNYDWIIFNEKEINKNPIKKKTNITLFDEINDIRDDNQLLLRTKKKEVSNIVINRLKENWKLLISENEMYYFNSVSKKLYKILSKNFRYFISNFTRLPLTDLYLKEIIANVITYTDNKGEKVQLKSLSYYRKSDNSLFLYNNEDIIHIPEKWEIKTIENGSEWIIFVKNNENDEKWNFIKNPLLNKNYLYELIDSVNFVESELTKEETRIVLEYYIYSIYFWWFLNNKIILILNWDMGSGKSFLLEMIYKLIYWNNANLSTLPKSNADFKSIVWSNKLVYLDNISLNVPAEMLDIINNASTWGCIKWRKLATNGELYEKKIDSHIAFTLIWNIWKQDLADRSIILTLERRENYISSKISQDKYLKNRDVIQSMICYKLQEILQNIKDYKEYEINFRIADFATFVLNNFKWEEKKIFSIFNKLKLAQQEFANSTDDFLMLLENILDNKEEILKEWEFYTSSELHIIFANYSKKNTRIVKYNYSWPKSLWKNLNNNIDSYKNTNGIEIVVHKAWWNIRKYSISRINDKKEKKLESI